MPAPSTNEAPEAIKARGAFYTPPEIARFMAWWAIRDPDARVLEPSCGDGVFLGASAARLAQLGEGLGRLVGVEPAGDEARKAKEVAPAADIRIASFFDITVADVGPVDAILGNPPYIRYHRWSGADRSSGIARSSEVGVDIGALASSWAPFVIHAASFLRPTGRLALVLPAELLHADYAAPVRSYLLKRFTSLVVIAFDRLVFDDAQVDAVLLLASNDDSLGLRVIRLRDERGLEGIDVGDARDAFPANGHGLRHRWSAAVDARSAALYDALVSSGAYIRLGEIASVDIGFVSGADSYFVLAVKDALALRLPERALLPAVARPSDMKGLRLEAAETSVLFRPDDEAVEDPFVCAYLSEGTRLGIDARYKPRHRRPWHRVPLPRQEAHLLLPYMSHHAPLMVANAGARNTNLIHGVTLRDPASVDARALAACSLSSVWALSAELEGRAYGGGVLKVETKEAERLLVPAIDRDVEARLVGQFASLDGLVRAGNRTLATEVVDCILGIDTAMLQEAARSYSDRRHGRGSGRGGRAVMAGPTPAA